MSAARTWRRRAGWAALVAALAWGVGQWPVTTRQGVDGEVRALTIPLFLKALRFVARDAEYRHLALTLTRGLRDPEAKLMRLYHWTREAIVPGVPQPLPVVDDHVWHIIVRGYGQPDQMADVLATLCAYAGLPAELTWLRPPGGGRPLHAVAMVKLSSRWYPIDPFYGIVIRDASGRLLSRDELAAHPDAVHAATRERSIGGFAYAQLLDALADPDALRPTRPSQQMLWPRVWQELGRGLQRFLTGGIRQLWSARPCASSES